MLGVPVSPMVPAATGPIVAVAVRSGSPGLLPVTVTLTWAPRKRGSRVRAAPTVSGSATPPADQAKVSTSVPEKPAATAVSTEPTTGAPTMSTVGSDATSETTESGCTAADAAHGEPVNPTRVARTANTSRLRSPRRAGLGGPAPVSSKAPAR